MKILLVNPEVPDTFWSLKSALKFVSKKSLLPPLGLLTVAAMLPRSWHKKLIDMNTDRLSDRHLKWADLVFLTGMIIQKKSVDNVIDRCKKLNVKVVAGGPLFDIFPENYSRIDHLVLKEAEVTLPHFLQDLQNGDPKPFYTSVEKADLAKTPIPQLDLIDIEKYGIMGIQYSRGCPFDCDFCNITTMLGHKVRTKTPRQIIAELENLYLHNWRGDVFFVDDNFIGKRQQLKNQLLPAIIEWMEKRKYPFAFNTQASLDIVDDPDLMSLMAKAGFDCIFIGIESPSQTSLTECNKNQNTGRDIVASVKKIQQFGIQVQGGFIIGFDSDKPGIFDKMINLIQDSGIVTAMVGLLNAPRGTRFYNKLKSQNRLTDPLTGDNMDCTMNFIPKMNMQELLSGYQKVLHTIYSQKYYCSRIKTFLENYNFNNSISSKLRYCDLKAFFKSIWHIGLIGKGKLHYWKLILWSLKKPQRLPLAVRLSIFGFHFRKMIKNIQPQIKQLASEPIGNDLSPDKRPKI